jgi:hypothetical protein
VILDTTLPSPNLSRIFLLIISHSASLYVRLPRIGGSIAELVSTSIYKLALGSKSWSGLSKPAIHWLLLYCSRTYDEVDRR